MPKILLLIFLLSLFILPLAEAGLLAGASRVKITPSYSVYLAGLGNNRKSEGVHDDIYASALYLNDGKTSVVIVSLDLIGLFHDDVEDIRGNKNDIIIACTHQHSGPDTLGLWGPDETTSGVNPEYLAFVKGKVREAIDKARKSPKPAILKVGEARVSEVAYNAREESLLDPTMTCLFVESPDGKPIAILVNYACHPEVLWEDNHLITSDFVYYLRELCERKIGGTTLFLNGALGGMVTPRVKEHSFSEARRVGETIGVEVIEAWRKAEKIQNPKITHRCARFKLPVENPRFLLASQMGIFKRKIQSGGIDTEMHFLDIGGKLQILTNPGEALPKVGFALKELLKAKYKMIIGLACDEIGYILTKEDFGTQLYSYESSMSLGPKIADVLLQFGRKLVSGTLAE
ncbi:neutral/alkaline non-lysosomal ceramidase N-terminal domain-containing protein [bacterium]|nr:neutral/alkaline non-lysosomal ceramidase N-terminal domain-containing protein [bacterium]